MRKKKLYIEDSEKYGGNGTGGKGGIEKGTVEKETVEKGTIGERLIGKGHRGWRRRNLGKIAGGAVAFALVAALGCTVGYGLIREGGVRGIDRVQASSLEAVSDSDMWDIPQEYTPMMDGMAPNTVSSGDCGRTVYLSEVAIDVLKEPGDLLVVLDPGHGGEDDGCVKSGVHEKEVNLQIALAVQTKLEELGYRVLMTRDSDLALTLDDRVMIANDAHADIYISIHQNSCEVSGPEGLEVWYCAEGMGNESEQLAKLVSKFVAQDTGAEDRGICETDTLRVLRESNMPSCLVETGFLSNAGERANLTNPEYQDKIAEGIASAVNLYFYPKTMYLTFDDGPSEENTNAVLDILKERGIQATFFLVGENVRRYPEVARRIAAEGHTIGIHCYSHDYGTIYENVESYLADFQEAYQAVYEATGVEAQLFRFPGGSINAYNGDVYEEIIASMTEKGFIYFDWNASLEDAVRNPDPKVLLANGLNSTMSRKRVVMLAHDVVYATSQCLEELLDELPEYRMEALTAEVEPIRFK